MASRGEFTPQIAEKMRAFLGRDACRVELRLYPYLQYEMVNSRRLDPAKVNQAERDVLSKLRADGHIEGGASGLAMTREFFLFMCDVLFDAYAAYDNEPSDLVSA